VPARSTQRGSVWLAPVALAAVVLVIVLLAAGGGGAGHHLIVTVPDATDALAGQNIQAAGQTVGHIASIEPVQRGRAVRIDLELSNAAWPLPTGSKFALRWGGTISYSNRYVLLTKGPANGAPLVDGQTLPAADFSVPVEFDQLIGTFTPPVRAGLKSFLDVAGSTFHVIHPDLRQAIATAPPALGQAAAVLQDLDADESAMNTLLVSSDHVVSAANAANPGVGQLVSGAATTFSAIASQTNALKEALSAAPPTLVAARQTLAHANSTLGTAGTLLSRLAPGVQQLQQLAGPLDTALGTLVTVGPDAVDTVRSAGAAAPALTPLLGKLTTLMPELGSIGRQSVNELSCIRPYTPDIVAFFSNWADWLSTTDRQDRYGRANAESLLPASNNAETETPAQAKAQYPGLTYGFPRPPGTNAGQPWFLPQCGAGPDALNPADDPEAKPYNVLEQLPPLMRSMK
jgi:phospholipid/cholesterol/gamma-HCH transport system substrate-binding protein